MMPCCPSLKENANYAVISLHITLSVAAARWQERIFMPGTAAIQAKQLQFFYFSQLIQRFVVVVGDGEVMHCYHSHLFASYFDEFAYLGRRTVLRMS